jgi:hypothetical protein
MAESTQFMFDHKEVATALVKQQGLNSGKWKLVIQFGFAATNVAGGEPPSGGGPPHDMVPAVVATVLSIGLARTEEESSLVVDAAAVNAAATERPPSRKTKNSKSK